MTCLFCGELLDNLFKLPIPFFITVYYLFSQYENIPQKIAAEMKGQKHLIHPTYRPDIDGLRGLAVLLVVIFHAFPNLLQGGFIGVDIFFVISGFLITTIIYENLKLNSFRFLEFYARRIKRIFPALLIVLISAHIFGWFYLSTGEYKQLGKHIAGGSGFISNLILWNESGYFDNAAETKPLLHLWSLGVEEQFYIFFPFLFYFIYKCKFSFKGSIFVGLIISFVVNVIFATYIPTGDFYSPVSRFWEILTGSMLTQIPKIDAQTQIKGVKLANIFSFFGFLLLGVGLWLINKNLAFPGWWALFPVLGAALILYAGESAILNKNLLTCKPAIFLGLISFPLYLVHWPLLTFWRLTRIQDIESYVYLGLIAVSIVVSWAIYAVVETKIRQSKSTKILLCLLALMSIAAFIGFNCYQREGMPFRKIVQNKFNYHLTSANGVSGCFNVLRDGVPNCLDVSQTRSFPRPLVFLWGDSHASHLNAGLLQAMQTQQFSVFDASQSACPPIVGFSPRGENSLALNENQKCLEHNEASFKLIERYRPDTVILSANWAQYDGLNQFNHLKNSSIKQTLERLKFLNIKNILLVGSFPIFYIDQPKLAAIYFITEGKNRSYKRFNYNSIEVDNVMANFSQLHGVQFISPIRGLCNEDGCLLSVSTKLLIPMGMDESHLTKDGSIFFINYLLESNQLSIK